MSERYDICIVGLKCFDLLNNVAIPKYLGGIEKLLVTLARGLSADGLKVAFVTFDEGQSDALEIDGITVYKAYKPDTGIRGLRFVYPKMTSIWQAMRRANAGVYLQMGAGVETAVTAIGTRMLGGEKRFIYCSGSDSDCLSELPLIDSKIEKFFYRWGLKNANEVVTQTQKQQIMLRQAFGNVSAVIPMPYESSLGVQPVSAEQRALESVSALWVGRVVEVKRLELLVEIATQLPQVAFHVVGTANSVSDYAKKVLSEAEQVSNITIHGRISDLALAELYNKCWLLCNTSSLEGFPTTFLEAWSYGLPVVTTFDPDSVVVNNNVGLVAKDKQSFVDLIEMLVEDEEQYLSLAVNAKRLHTDKYTFNAILPRYRELIANG